MTLPIEPTTNLFIFSQSLQGEPAPVAQLLTNSKMTLWMTVRKGSKDCGEKPDISTQENDDLAKMLRPVQMMTTKHDGDGAGDKEATLPKTQNKGTMVASTMIASTTMADTIAKKGTTNRMTTNKD